MRRRQKWKKKRKMSRERKISKILTCPAVPEHGHH